MRSNFCSLFLLDFDFLKWRVDFNWYEETSFDFSTCNAVTWRMELLRKHKPSPPFLCVFLLNRKFTGKKFNSLVHQFWLIFFICQVICLISFSVWIALLDSAFSLNYLKGCDLELQFILQSMEKFHIFGKLWFLLVNSGELKVKKLRFVFVFKGV